MEAICDDRKARAAPLGKRLKELAERGEIPPVLAEMSDVLRTVGNSAAHALQPVTQPMTWAIDEFFRRVVEYVYVAPSQLAKFKQELAKLRETRVPEPSRSKNKGADALERLDCIGKREHPIGNVSSSSPLSLVVNNYERFIQPHH